MFRHSDARFWVLASLLTSAVLAAGVARAQDEPEGEYYEPRRPRSLSARLEQFRKDLLGSPEEEYVEENPAPIEKPETARRSAERRTESSDRRAETNVKGHAIPSSGPSRKPAPASRMVTKSTAAPRIASRPVKQAEPAEETFAEPVPRKAEKVETVTEANAGPTIADETRSNRLSSAGARPAKKRGAFDLPTPRTARLERETPDIEEEPAEVAQEEGEDVVASPRLSAPSNAGNVLFSSKSPMLSVEATGPRKILVGREAVFQILVRNVGEVAASGVVVKLNIPAYAEVVGSEATNGNAAAPPPSEQGATLAWQIDRLDVRGRETLTLKIIPRKSVPLDLAAQWTCTPEASQAVVEVQEAKLSLSLTGPREIFYGQSKIYKLTIANPGNGDAENVNVTLMPIGKSDEAPAGYRVGMLEAGDSKTIDIELTARQAGTLEIKAQASGDGGLRTEVVEPVVVRRAQLKVAVAGSKVKYAGTPSVFRVRVANVGDAVAEGVELSAMLPQDGKFLNASNGGKFSTEAAKVVWQIGAMQPGDDRTFELHCTLNAPGDNSLQATVQAGNDLTSSAAAVTHVEALADLKLEVRDPQGPVAIGEDVQYEVVVRNRGTKAAEGIDIVTFFSEGLEASAVEGVEHQIAAGQVTMKTIPSIGPGGETTIRVNCKSDRGGNLVFRAEVSCRNPGTKLAAEETTHFYGDDAAVASESSTDEETTEAAEAPTVAEPESRYPTRAE